MKRTRALGFILALTTTTLTVRAGAQAPAPTAIDATSARADDLAHQGNELALKYNWDGAESLFQQAWALKQSYDIGGNLGIAELNQGKYRDAAEHLAFALRRFPANGKADHRELLREKLEKAKERVGVLTITASKAGAEVLIDGHRVGLAPLAEMVFVEPGTHKVEARLHGYESATQTVEVPKGASSELALTLHAEAGSHLPPPVSRAPRVELVVAGGVVTGVALAVGIGLLVEAGRKGASGRELHDTIVQEKHSCVIGDVSYDSRCADLSSVTSSGDAFHSAGIGLLVGAGAVAVGTAAYFFWPRSSPSVTTTSAFHVVPAVSATNTGLLVLGAF